ncbi:polysaccharide deacetylase family protein [Paraclostridium ghonii]|uniref:Peptidoglycan/xylan/chitin deacetylase (PgdA/CDA1 family) n=1 Tax=Paraclostridium ghonii TaxID=29358 RepID=A0ABU0N300_9FIRM|nr:polysaccharide deacetylase family protein [Paeniclostridium ghonii]MDQ0557538.1 peptidoglycan/xylan/chitin deacetylase (PgdA/CDA1 family) [Paeniclostridium ghonii]
MKRKIKPIFLSVSTVVLLLFLLFITFDKIIATSNDKNNIDVNLIESNKIALTDLMGKASNVNNRGPKPKPEKVAYITIDDGPSKYTDGILSILDSNNVKATFFMIDGNMKQHPEQLKRIAQEGHSMGFHSVSHDISVLYKTPEKTVNEFEKCQETLNKIAKVNSNLMRLPYGSKPYTPESSYNALVNEGFKVWDWNLDTEDWKGTPQTIVNNVNKYADQHNEVVLLMHEKEQSVKALQGIIDELKQKGYTIMTIEENDIPKNYWEQNLRS